ncbi:hypothetical protein JZ751_024988 [Albula glossodonta]|uniref:Uncharacterized protein n=1 Tax=Albula glossodonta TaxID=121402 RepID=A0A8T2PM91_9TELE|nr:hypothetical protein JZ751_024988 [Albula glossodonta]
MSPAIEEVGQVPEEHLGRDLPEEVLQQEITHTGGRQRARSHSADVSVDKFSLVSQRGVQMQDSHANQQTGLGANHHHLPDYIWGPWGRYRCLRHTDYWPPVTSQVTLSRTLPSTHLYLWVRGGGDASQHDCSPSRMFMKRRTMGNEKRTGRPPGHPAASQAAKLRSLHCAHSHWVTLGMLLITLNTHLSPDPKLAEFTSSHHQNSH